MSLRVVEGIAGMWHYHLAEDGKFTSLCGKSVMNTVIPLSSWEVGGNPALNEKWCARCAGSNEAFIAGVRKGESP